MCAPWARRAGRQLPPWAPGQQANTLRDEASLLLAQATRQRTTKGWGLAQAGLCPCSPRRLHTGAMGCPTGAGWGRKGKLGGGAGEGGREAETGTLLQKALTSPPSPELRTLLPPPDSLRVSPGKWGSGGGSTFSVKGSFYTSQDKRRSRLQTNEPADLATETPPARSHFLLPLAFF